MEDIQVGIAMGSKSDWPIMEKAAAILRSFEVAFEARVLSAHRTPEPMRDYALSLSERGVRVIIVGAGGAAHLPGMFAAYSLLPVIGVPIPSQQLKGMDSLLSIVQMPRGIPVATVSIGGAENAGLLAVQILALTDTVLMQRLRDYRLSMQTTVDTMDTEVRAAADSL